MSPGEVHNWIAIYLATFILSMVCAVLAAISVGIELIRERFWQGLKGPREWVLFAPKTWWRWQKRYLLGTPVILAIIAFFAATMAWGH